MRSIRAPGPATTSALRPGPGCTEAPGPSPVVPPYPALAPPTLALGRRENEHHPRQPRGGRQAGTEALTGFKPLARGLQRNGRLRQPGTGRRGAARRAHARSDPSGSEPASPLANRRRQGPLLVSRCGGVFGVHPHRFIFLLLKEINEGFS